MDGNFFPPMGLFNECLCGFFYSYVYTIVRSFLLSSHRSLPYIPHSILSPLYSLATREKLFALISNFVEERV
jgi:hypothetical protein